MTARVSVNIDGEIKQKAQSILNEIGIDMTTAVDIFLRTIIREERIPFELQTKRAFQDDVHQQYILAELERAMVVAGAPDSQWRTHDEVMMKLNQQREARKSV